MYPVHHVDVNVDVVDDDDVDVDDVDMYSSLKSY